MLSLAGEWIVSAGHQLEAAGASLISLAKDAKRVILDLAGLATHGHRRRVVHRSRGG